MRQNTDLCLYPPGIEILPLQSCAWTLCQRRKHRTQVLVSKLYLRHGTAVATCIVSFFFWILGGLGCVPILQVRQATSAWWAHSLSVYDKLLSASVCMEEIMRLKKENISQTPSCQGDIEKGRWAELRGRDWALAHHLQCCFTCCWMSQQACGLQGTMHSCR